MEQKLHIIVLLLNDSAYGMIKWKAVSPPIPASTKRNRRKEVSVFGAAVYLCLSTNAP